VQPDQRQPPVLPAEAGIAVLPPFHDLRLVLGAIGGRLGRRTARRKDEKGRSQGKPFHAA
jgi:hypothetical protein